MPALIALLLLYLFLALIVLPIWTIARFKGQERAIESLRRKSDRLQEELNALQRLPRDQPASPAPAVPPIPVATESPPAVVPPVVIPTAVPPPVEDIAALPTGLAAMAAPPPEVPAAPGAGEPPPIEPPPVPAAEPPPLIAPPAPPVYRPPVRATPAINWEQFMGAKLFAWLGGFALFLGVAFFVKYSFEHNLIPAEVRVALGFLLGLGLIVGGLKIPRARYAVTAQTLVATGVVSLYAVTFACNSIYHFGFFTPTATFLLMALVTATAFIIAVRLEAQVVAILGILGGFLTPILLRTGQDNPGGLFGYLALLNVGLVAVALHRRWFHLVPLGAAGTVLMMVGWAGEFYTGPKTSIAMVICLGFCALFLAANTVARWTGRSSPLLSRTAAVLPAVAFCFAAFFLESGGISARPGLFFTYVFLVSLAVFLLAWSEATGGLVTGAAVITALLMIEWSVACFTPAQAPVIVTVCLVFCAIYFAVYLVARRFGRDTLPVLGAAIALPFVSLGFALFFAGNAEVGARPGLVFGFILASDLVLLALVWLDQRLGKLHFIAGLVVFVLLAVWTADNLTDALLAWALAAYLGFAALHAVYPLLLERHRATVRPTWWSQLFPPLSLVLMLFPLFKLETASLLLWPAILLVDLLAVVLAVVSASLAAVGAVLVLTLVATGLCIFKVPASFVVAPSLLLVIAGFAVFFFAASTWLARRLGDRLPALGAGQFASVFGETRAQLPAFSSLLPFLLLIMVCARLAVPDPSAVFGLGLLLVVLTLGLARLMVIEWLPACALAGMAALEFAWQARHFTPAAAPLALGWHLGFYAVFAVYPFLFRRPFAELTGPWAVAALSGPAHFWMSYQTILLGWPEGWPKDFSGLIPAAFACAPLASLVVVLKKVPAENPRRLGQLAWFGGVGLFFVTLIFPIQCERQWLTVAWALEGAALLWLFLRVPHPGLRLTGTALLITAFARLALNPAVFQYHERGDTALFNWYLYAYGIATVALFLGARFLSAPARDPARPAGLVLGINVPPLLNTLGVILAFLLLNIEIADYFTAPGSRALAFQFSGNFARDMSYTIGWALFALGLLAGGLWKKTRAARYAAIALLSVALLKLFFHDLARLEALYRIGALFAVAVIAIVASLAYQRFLPSNEKTPPPAP